MIELAQCILTRSYHHSEEHLAVWLPADLARHGQEIKIDSVWWRVIEVWPHRIYAGADPEQEAQWRRWKSDPGLDDAE